MLENDAAKRLNLFRKAVQQTRGKLVEAKKTEAATAEAEATKLDAKARQQEAAEATRRTEEASLAEKQARQVSCLTHCAFKFNHKLVSLMHACKS
jgi:hypothetical protein